MLVKISLVLLGMARLAGNAKRCPSRLVEPLMDLPVPPPGGADHSFPSDRRTSLRYPYQRKALCQPCHPQELKNQGSQVASGPWSVAREQTAALSGLATNHLALITSPLGSSSKSAGNQADDIWFMGASQDLSASGIGFILHRRFDPGTLLTIELERPKRDSWAVLPARVMRVSPQPDGNWKFGCALIHAMSADELRGWITSQESTAAAHR